MSLHFWGLHSSQLPPHRMEVRRKWNRILVSHFIKKITTSTLIVPND